ncbi:hypothetical protein SBADM41S_01125 [Streptomyces badius]
MVGTASRRMSRDRLVNAKTRCWGRTAAAGDPGPASAGRSMPLRNTSARWAVVTGRGRERATSRITGIVSGDTAARRAARR